MRWDQARFENRICGVKRFDNPPVS